MAAEDIVRDVLSGEPGKNYYGTAAQLQIQGWYCLIRVFSMLKELSSIHDKVMTQSGGLGKLDPGSHIQDRGGTNTR